MPPFELRPLGLGELLDRAITLCIRHFGALFAVIAVSYVPFQAVQWLLTGRVVARRTMSLSGEDSVLIAVDLALALPVFALTRTAVAVVAQGAYLGQPVTLGSAYLRALRRFFAQIVTQLCAAVTACVLVVFVSIPTVAIAAVSAITGRELTTPIAIAIVAGAVLLAALGSWLFFGAELASVLAASTRRPYSALPAALRATVFARPWRALLAALILAGVAAGVLLVTASLVELIPADDLRSLIWFTVSALESIVTECVTVAFLVVYAIDIAVRREGYDIATAIAAREAYQTGTAGRSCSDGTPRTP